MKPNYKNWMPKGMIRGTAAGCAVCLVLFLVFGVSGLLAAGIWRTVLTALFLVLTIVLLAVTAWMVLLYRAFSYDGKRQLSRVIIDGVAARVVLPEGGRGLPRGKFRVFTITTNNKEVHFENCISFFGGGACGEKVVYLPQNMRRITAVLSA